MNQPNNHARKAAEAQQQHDAKDLLEIALTELAEDQKAYQRIENNVRIFVDRTNHELAALHLVIQQKMENVETLKRIVAGYFVKPEPAAISNQKTPAAPQEPSPPAEEPKTNGKTAEIAEPVAAVEVPS